MQTTRALVSIVPLLLAASAVFAACGGNGGDAAGTTGGSTTTAAGGAGGSGGTGGEGGSVPPPVYRKTISGDMTWQVTFDDAAKAAGATDCTYTRHYDAVEDASAPWLCPSCEVMFTADVTMTAGQADCFTQISPNPPAETEWIGYGNGTWYRSPQGPLFELGTTTITDTSISTEHTIIANESAIYMGTTYDFLITGQFTQGQEEGDPLNGFVAPATYACGWPKSDAPPYGGNYQLLVGETVPDGIFKDHCDEPVRLHDFKGTYLIIDMAAIDCPPCNTMADGEEAFIADMKAQGIDVHVITLLAPLLSDVFGETSKTKLTNWVNKYDLTSPVLGDRGWGLAIFEPAIGADTVGYPSWVIVNPDLKVVAFDTGFSSWDDFKMSILADAP